MYTLYYWPGYCSLATHIALRWIGAPYQLILADRRTRQSEAFRRLNPSSTVPVLVDDDWVISQNTAILNYLAESHPEALLTGTDVRGRAIVNRWLGYINSDVHKAFSPLMHPERLLGDEDVRRQTLENARWVLRRHFEVLDQTLHDNGWIAGEHRSIADAYLFVLTRWAYDKHVDLHELEGIQDHFERIRQDPEVQTALIEEGLLGASQAVLAED